MSIDLKTLPTRDLLALHADIGKELRDRGTIRSANNPTGDYAEHLFARAFGWKLVSNSNAAFDAVDDQGIRYQVKARRMTRGPHSSRQLGSLRNLPAAGFDVLAAVLLTEAYDVFRGILIPHSKIEALCRFSTHVNAWILRLDESHWRVPGVTDVTDMLKVAAANLE